MRAHCRERRDLLDVEPGKKRADGDRVGGAGVRVADVGGEEIEEPQARVLAGVGNQPRHQHRGCDGRPDIAVGTMIASAWLDLVFCRPARLPASRSTSTNSSISMLMLPPPWRVRKTTICREMSLTNDCFLRSFASRTNSAPTGRELDHERGRSPRVGLCYVCPSIGGANDRYSTPRRVHGR